MIVSSVDMYNQLLFYLELIGRLLLALVLGGIIGYERENMHRPAGFRTHILVCIGSALVMITSEFIFRRYSGHANVDPARLGAQVISGIGFLGAGTIIREGFSVKGLTTAASLWAVSCVGIAAGIGFYEGAAAATVLIYITLLTLKKMQNHFVGRSPYHYFYIQADDIPGRIGTVNHLFSEYNLQVKNIEFFDDAAGKTVTAKFLVKIPGGFNKLDFMEKLHRMEGIRKIYEE